MSQENVIVVRRLLDAFNARDVNLLVNLSTEDCEWRPFRAQLEGIVYRGHTGIRQFVSDMDADWETFRIDPIAFHDHGERVAVIGQVDARGQGSGVEFETIAGFVHELDKGRIRRLISYSDVEAALAALEKSPTQSEGPG